MGDGQGKEVIFVARSARKLGLVVRPREPADDGFVRELYASTRWEELAATGWPDSMKRALLDQQHAAQRQHYSSVFPDAEWLIVERQGSAFGRLYLRWSETEVRIVDISLLPQARARGYGSALIRDVQRQARASRRTVALSVVEHNSARHLYARLGFVPVPGIGTDRMQMLWPA